MKDSGLSGLLRFVFISIVHADAAEAASSPCRLGVERFL